jgi:hypothetical protein
MAGGSGGGEESDNFETELKGWLEAQEVGVQFGHAEGSDWERTAVNRFLRRHCEGKARPFCERMFQLRFAVFDKTLTILSVTKTDSEGCKTYRWHLQRWGGGGHIDQQ